MKSRSFTTSCRIRCNPAYIRKYVKIRRSRNERRYCNQCLNNITNIEDFDILPKSKFKTGHDAWVIS